MQRVPAEYGWSSRRRHRCERWPVGSAREGLNGCNRVCGALAPGAVTPIEWNDELVRCRRADGNIQFLISLFVKAKANDQLADERGASESRRRWLKSLAIHSLPSIIWEAKNSIITMIRNLADDEGQLIADGLRITATRDLAVKE